MTEFLTTLAEITLTMSAVILLLLLLGPLLFKRYAARWRYWAWLAVAVRLLIPFNLTLPQAPVQLEAPADRVVYRYTPPQTQTVLPPQPVQDPPGQPDRAEAEPKPDLPAAQPAATRSVSLSDVLPWVWLAGTALLLGYHLVGWLRFRRYVARWGAPVEDPEVLSMLAALRAELGLRPQVALTLCPGLGGPMLTGLFRPAILLPRLDYDRESLWFVLRHELTHCKRRDIAYKVLLLLSNAAHWFNPLVWIMVRAAEGDMERACDDGVVAGLPPEARARYGDVILAAVKGEAKRAG